MVGQESAPFLMLGSRVPLAVWFRPSRYLTATEDSYWSLLRRNNEGQDFVPEIQRK